MTVQIVFDAASPRLLAQFWAAALGYVRQPPPEGFADWDTFLDSVGVPADQRDTKDAVVDPSGSGPRLFFQKVPEAKTAKNRVHLDVNAGAGIVDPDERHRAVRAKVDELVGLGATVVREQQEFGDSWVVLLDPEGNEFCVQ
ncbi:VOC family protein [Jatrophihabitans fulvus]